MNKEKFEYCCRNCHVLFVVYLDGDHNSLVSAKMGENGYFVCPKCNAHYKIIGTLENLQVLPAGMYEQYVLAHLSKKYKDHNLYFCDGCVVSFFGTSEQFIHLHDEKFSLFDKNYLED